MVMILEENVSSVSTPISTKVEIYTWESCPRCLRVKSFFDALGTDYIEHALADEDAQSRLGREMHNVDSLPVVLINDVLVGGLNDLMLLEASGELQELLFPTYQQAKRIQ